MAAIVSNDMTSSVVASQSDDIVIVIPDKPEQSDVIAKSVLKTPMGLAYVIESAVQQ